MKSSVHVIKPVMLLSPAATFRAVTFLFIFIMALLTTACGGGESGAQPAGDTASVTAKTGPIIAVRVGESPVLDGSRSFSSSSTSLNYHWSFTHKPDASKAKLHAANTENPSFVVDTRGVYIVQLVVSANGTTSERAIQTVIATLDGERLTGAFNHPGLSSHCVNCHDGADSISSVNPGKSPDHIATSNTCEACHTPQGATIIPFVDHQEVFGHCSECHNGTRAIGKSEFHIATGAECDDCHNTSSFLQLASDGSFDHSNITRACSGCHNGTVAIGKTSTIADFPAGTHPLTRSECGYCHTTESFLNAYPDHTGPDVTGEGISCDSCHGTGVAQGQPTGHPLTNVDCDTCHGILTFSLGGIFNHSVIDPIVQPCESCHNDNNSINAPGKGSALPSHPSTTADCSSCHTTESFIPAFGIDHTDPDILAIRCDACHNGIEATGIPLTTPFYEHMPIASEDCRECHTPGTFTTGTYDHAGIISGCTSCHNNRISVGKLENHIPTNPDNQDCAECHTTTTFTGVIFEHAGIDTGNCTLCHTGDISTGMPLNHVPPGTDPITGNDQDCSACHDITNFNSFAGISFNHTGIQGRSCASCHDTGIATPKKLNHIPAQDDCGVCHSTDSFIPTMFLVNLHQDINRGCEGCHTSQFLPAQTDLVKSTTHLPTSQDCDVCHKIDSFSSPTNFAHTGITGNCKSCHNGNPDYVAAGARGATDTAIHRNAKGDCVACHNTTNFLDAYIDHKGPEVTGKRCDTCHNGIDATGKDAKTSPPHVITTEDCNICHVTGGKFTPAAFNHTGIIDNCASCHDGVAATGLTPDHLSTDGKDCSACHNTTAFIGASYDHTGIIDNCASCHDGVTASGMTPPPDHVPTNDDCSDCHQTTGFIPASFNHAGIVDNCASCHDAGFATGKTATHVATNSDCGVCHNTSTFTGAVFDHSGIVNNCESCHDGITAIGKDAKTNPAHIETALDCHLCHTTATFHGGTWVHDDSSAGQCDQCHSDIGGARAEPVGHLNTTVQCDVCHSTNSWAPSIFRHDPRGNYPGDHRISLSCNRCHGNTVTESIPWPWSRYAPDCAACHAGDFESESDHNGGRSGTVEQNRNCGASGCHNVSSSEF